MRKIFLILLAVLLGGFLLMQFVPYGRNHSNPPVISEPNWDSPQTRALAVDACFDCHSNETNWPWYSNVAPVSWMVQRHTDEGRETLNFSEWGQGSREAEEGDHMAESIYEGEMPLFSFLLTHPEARLNEAEKDALAKGLLATAGDGGNEAEHQQGDRENEENEAETGEHEENEDGD